jgi:hypothetical protein
MSDAAEPEPNPISIEISVDASKALDAFQRAQSAVVFTFHPDLHDLGRELDNTFPHAFGDPA